MISDISMTTCMDKYKNNMDSTTMTEKQVEIVRDLLTDLFYYRSNQKHEMFINPNYHRVKNYIRLISDDIVFEIMKENQDDIRANDLLSGEISSVIEIILNEVYKECDSKEKYTVRSIAVFSYIINLCKDIPKKYYTQIIEHILTAMMNSIQGRYSIMILADLCQEDKTFCSKMFKFKLLLCASIALGIVYASCK